MVMLKLTFADLLFCLFCFNMFEIKVIIDVNCYLCIYYIQYMHDIWNLFDIKYVSIFVWHFVYVKFFLILNTSEAFWIQFFCEGNTTKTKTDSSYISKLRAIDRTAPFIVLCSYKDANEVKLKMKSLSLLLLPFFLKNRVKLRVQWSSSEVKWSED